MWRGREREHDKWKLRTVPNPSKSSSMLEHSVDKNAFLCVLPVSQLKRLHLLRVFLVCARYVPPWKSCLCYNVECSDFMYSERHIHTYLTVPGLIKTNANIIFFFKEKLRPLHMYRHLLNYLSWSLVMI